MKFKKNVYFGGGGGEEGGGGGEGADVNGEVKFL